MLPASAFRFVGALQTLVRGGLVTGVLRLGAINSARALHLILIAPIIGAIAGVCLPNLQLSLTGQ